MTLIDRKGVANEPERVLFESSEGEVLWNYSLTVTTLSYYI